MQISNMKTQIKIALAITSMSWAILNAEESSQPPTRQPEHQQADAPVKLDKRPYRGVLFEYKIVTVMPTAGNTDTTKLNSLGDEGWELVAVAHASGKLSSEEVYYLKRQKISGSQQRVVPPGSHPNVEPPLKDQSPTE